MAPVEVAGSGAARVDTGLPILDELLALLASSAGFDLELSRVPPDGDPDVEGIGRTLGRELAPALSRADAPGLGSAWAPQDEALAHVVLEASGRPLVVSNVDLTAEHVGGLRGDLLARLLEGIADGAGLTVHVRLLHGDDTEHVLDAVAKALGLALAQACGR